SKMRRSIMISPYGRFVPRYGAQTKEVTRIGGCLPHINARTDHPRPRLNGRFRAAGPAAAADGAGRAADGAAAAPAFRPGDWLPPNAPRAGVLSIAPARGSAPAC